MKHIYRTGLLIFISMFFLGCSKVKRPRKIVGRIFYSCNQPATNYNAKIVQNYNFLRREKESVSFKTDSLGYFEIMFDPDNKSPLLLYSGILNLGGIDLRRFGDVIDLGDIYKGIQFQIRLKTTASSSSSSSDTLYFYLYEDANTPLKFPGPFTNETLDTITYYHRFTSSRLAPMNVYEKDTVVLNFNYSIHSNGSVTYSNSQKLFLKESDYCSGNAKEIILKTKE